MWTADDMVDSVFLIYLKNIDNRGFCVRFRLLSTLFKQWGDFGSNTANNSETTLPIAFASELYVVVITDTASNGYPLSYGVYQLSSKSFYAYSRRINTGNVENVIFGRWIAIGH